MGAGHGHRLHFHGHSPVHRAPAHLKVLALLGFMLVVVATPRQAYPVFALWAAVLLGVVVMLVLSTGLFWLVRRREPRGDDADADQRVRSEA